MKIYQVGKWFIYSAALSFLPLYVNGLLCLVDNYYQFNLKGTLTDLLITTFSLSLTILVDNWGYSHRNNNALLLLKGVITAITATVCIITLIFYGWSLNAKDGQMNERSMGLLVGISLSITILFGIVSQAVLNDPNPNPNPNPNP